MTSLLKRSHLLIATLVLPFTSALAQPTLTGIEIFAADSGGSYTSGFVADTLPGVNFNIWIQTLGGTHLNGPSDAQAGANLPLALGLNSFRLFVNPGSDQSHYGVNLYFGGSINPAISAFAPRLTLNGPHSFSANGSSSTVGVPGNPAPAGANTLSFQSGNYLVTLTDYYWAQQNVFSLDQGGSTTDGPDGLLDYVGGLTFDVTVVPEPGLSLWAAGLLIAGVAGYRRNRK